MWLEVPRGNWNPTGALDAGSSRDRWARPALKQRTYANGERPSTHDCERTNAFYSSHKEQQALKRRHFVTHLKSSLPSPSEEELNAAASWAWSWWVIPPVQQPVKVRTVQEKEGGPLGFPVSKNTCLSICPCTITLRKNLILHLKITHSLLLN